MTDIVRAWEHNGAYFCPCKGTGILNIEQHYAYGDACEAAMEEGRTYRVRPPETIECETDHFCTVCGVDMIDRGFELDIERGKERRYELFYCSLTCIIEDRGIEDANWVQQNRQFVMRNRQDEVYDRRLD